MRLPVYSPKSTIFVLYLQRPRAGAFSDSKSSDMKTYFRSLLLGLAAVMLSLPLRATWSDVLPAPAPVHEDHPWELKLLTPPNVYGPDGFRLEVRADSRAPQTLTGLTVCCRVDGQLYRQTPDDATRASGDALTFSFTPDVPRVYGQPVPCEVWLEHHGQVFGRQTKLITPYYFKPHRRTVVEKITGMWCPNCTSGALAMDSLALLYPDRFIGIALHSRDPLQQSNYVGLLPFPVLPSAYFNRKYMERRPLGTVVEGDQTYFVLGAGGWGTKFAQYAEEPTVADMDVVAELEGNTIRLETRTRFAVSLDEAFYQLAFVVVEDHVRDDRYYQYNNLSGTGIHAGGYEDLPYVIEDLEFNHVGRTIHNSLHGISESVPTVLEAGETYTFHYEFDVPLSVQNPAHVRIVALLIDVRTGEIVNANQTAPLSATGVSPLFPSSASGWSWRYADGAVQIHYRTEADLPMTFRLYDVQGQLVSQQHLAPSSAEGTLSLPLPSASGFYILSVAQGHQTFARKIFIP